MTGATPHGLGEQTQPMACPPDLAERGPYADADTIDGPVPGTGDAGADSSMRVGHSGCDGYSSRHAPVPLRGPRHAARAGHSPELSPHPQ